MLAVTRMKYLFLLVFIVFSTGAPAGPLVAGDEISSEAFVAWTAVIDKVSETGANGYRVKAKLDFRGRTSEGNQIRGTGKLRFVGEPNGVFAIGDQLRGSDSLKYWATVKSIMGEDLAMIRGTGVLDLMTNGSLRTTVGAIEFKAALETYNGN